MANKSRSYIPKGWMGGQWCIQEKFSIFHSVGLLCNSMIFSTYFIWIGDKWVRIKERTECRISRNRERLYSHLEPINYSISNPKALLLQKDCNKIVNYLNPHSIFEKALWFGSIFKSTVFLLETQFVWNVPCNRFGYIIDKSQPKSWKWPIVKD